MNNNEAGKGPAGGPFHALTIAGSDSCGGAGIQADIKTMTCHGVEAASVVTAVTAQNTMGVTEVAVLPPELVSAQLDAVLADLPITAAKTGMLASAEVIAAIVAGLRSSSIQLVVDPVMVATSGAQLLAPEAVQILVSDLLPLCTLVTPNLPEARALTGLDEATPEQLGEAMLQMGCQAVLIKGGHGSGDRVDDLLLTPSGPTRFSHRRIDNNFHGTGCALSAAITARLARGDNLAEAVAAAIDWLQQRLQRPWQTRSGHLGMLPFD